MSLSASTQIDGTKRERIFSHRKQDKGISNRNPLDSAHFSILYWSALSMRDSTPRASTLKKKNYYKRNCNCVHQKGTGVGINHVRLKT